MIIWGYRTRITKSDVDDVLKESCPQCKGDLELSDMKKWFTLYFIPVFPISTVDTFYKCCKCEQTYKKEIKEMLQKGNKDREKIEKEARKMFATTLAACLTHMAKADGTISKEERAELDRIKKTFKEFKTDIDKTIAKVEKAKDNSEVYQSLQRANQVMTKEGMITMIAQIARMLLADGKIDKKEEKLMKEYMMICGIPTNLFDDMIKKVKEAMNK